MERLVVHFYAITILLLIGEPMRAEATFDTASFVSLASSADCVCLFRVESAVVAGGAAVGSCKMQMGGTCPRGKIVLERPRAGKHLDDAGPPFWDAGDWTPSIVALERGEKRIWRLARGFRASRLPLASSDDPRQIEKALKVAIAFWHDRVTQKNSSPELDRHHSAIASDVIVGTHSATAWWLVSRAVDVQYIDENVASVIVDRAAVYLEKHDVSFRCEAQIPCSVRRWTIGSAAQIAILPRFHGRKVGARSKETLFKFLWHVVKEGSHEPKEKDGIHNNRELVESIVRILESASSSPVQRRAKREMPISSKMLKDLEEKLVGLDRAEQVVPSQVEQRK